MSHPLKNAHHYPEVGVPFNWPLGLALRLEEQSLNLEEKNFKFLDEVLQTEVKRPQPTWASPNKKLFSLHTFTLRDFSTNWKKGEIPTLVIPPYAGHTSIIADFHRKQSLVETLLQNGIHNVVLTEWHSATMEMKDYDIDNYLAELNVAVDDLGGKVNLIGLCQGGWFSSLFAARFPEKIATLILAGSPIDTQAGKGPIKEYADGLPFSFYEQLVASGHGLMRGAFMLEGFKSMHPEKQFVEKYVELYEHINEPDYVKRQENFERWYEYTINLPGKWYLQVIKHLFKENQFVKGKFVALGQKLDPKSITCPVYLLAGKKDDITPKEQVFHATKYFGTPKEKLEEELAEGGHIGLFMGSKALTNNWPHIAKWIIKNQ